MSDRNRRFDRQVLAAVLDQDEEVGARNLGHRIQAPGGAVRISNALERLTDDGYLVSRMNEDGLRRYQVAGRLGARVGVVAS